MHRNVILGLLFSAMLTCFPARADIPTNLDEFRQILHGGSSTATFVVWDKELAGVAYLGGDVSGMYKSIDSAQSWENLGRSMPCSSISGVFQADSDPDTFYATCAMNGNYGYVGVFKSTDHTATWTQKQSTWSYTRYTGNVLAIDHSNPDIVYAVDPATNGDVYRSINGGTSWSVILADPFSGGTTLGIYLSSDNRYLYVSRAAGSGANVRVIDLSDLSSTTHTLAGTYATYNYNFKGYTKDAVEHVCVTAGYNIQCTSDDGATWTPTADAFAAETTYAFYNFDVIVDGDNVWFYGAGFDNFNFFTTVNRVSKDSGASWQTPAGTTTYDLVANPGEAWGYANTHTRTSVAINPSDHNHIVYTNDADVWNSHDFGTNTTNVSTGFTNQVSTTIQVALNGDYFYGMMDGGAYKSTDKGQTWTAILGGRAGDYTAGITGDAWQIALFGSLAEWDSGDGVVLIATQSWAGSYNDKCRIFRSTDSGSTFSEITGVFPTIILYTDGGSNPGSDRAMAVCPSNPDVVAIGISGLNGATEGGVWISEDRGASWTKTPYDVNPSDATWGRWENTLAFDPTDATCQSMALGLRTMFGYTHGYVKTTNRFTTKTSVGTTEVLGLAYKPGTSDIYTTTCGSAGAAVFKKNGTTIKTFPGTDAQSSCAASIMFDPHDSNRVFVSTSFPNKDNTLYVSDNINLGASATWTDIGYISLPRIGSAGVMTIDYTRGDSGYLLFPSWGSGLYEFDLGQSYNTKVQGVTMTGVTVE